MLKLKKEASPGRVVEMWVRGRDSKMLADIGTRMGALHVSGGSSRGGCRSTGLSGSSVLWEWLGAKHCGRGWDSKTAEETGGTAGASSDALENSETNRRLVYKKKIINHQS